MEARLTHDDIIMYTLQTFTATKNIRAEWEMEVMNWELVKIAPSFIAKSIGAWRQKNLVTDTQDPMMH